MDKKLLIKAPVNSFDAAKLQVDAGAGEIYVGFKDNCFEMLTFSGRYKKSIFNNKETSPNYDEFKKIVELAHDNNVQVELVANTPSLTDSAPYFRDKYLEYVKLGEKAGVDRIIVGDLGNIIFLKENNIQTPITASTFMATTNRYQLKFLESLGVKKVVLPHQLTLKEITSMVENTNMEIEIFGHFGCSFIESTCYLFHKVNDEFNLGVPCRALYNVGGSDRQSHILDVTEDCSICRLKEIMETGVASIKTIGRDLEPKFMAGITKMYSLAIDMYMQGYNKNEVLESLKNEFTFLNWDQTFCKSNKCKYVNTQYYI